MSNPAPAPQDPASFAAGEAPDPSVLRAERRLRLLEELAEIGMELARRLRPGAAANGASGAGATDEPVAETGQAKGRDPADTFGRLSRAIRLTLALEARTDAELRDLKAGMARARAEEQAQAAERARIAAAKDLENRIARVRHLVLGVVDAEIEDVDACDAICRDLDELLEEHESDFRWAERPLRETVERLCRDLALSPDWSRWADDGWTLDDPPVRPPAAKPKQSGARLAGQAGRFQAGHDLE